MRWTAAPKAVPLCAHLGLLKAFQDLASDNYPGKKQTTAHCANHCQFPLGMHTLLQQEQPIVQES